MIWEAVVFSSGGMVWTPIPIPAKRDFFLGQLNTRCVRIFTTGQKYIYITIVPWLWVVVWVTGSLHQEEKCLHCGLQATYFADICNGAKTWEFRSFSKYWGKRIEGATHIVFSRGNLPSITEDTFSIIFQGFSCNPDLKADPIYIYIYIHIRTHIHNHIYIYNIFYLMWKSLQREFLFLNVCFHEFLCYPPRIHFREASQKENPWSERTFCHRSSRSWRAKWQGVGLTLWSGRYKGLWDSFWSCETRGNPNKHTESQEKHRGLPEHQGWKCKTQSHGSRRGSGGSVHGQAFPAQGIPRGQEQERGRRGQAKGNSCPKQPSEKIQRNCLAAFPKRVHGMDHWDHRARQKK